MIETIKNFELIKGEVDRGLLGKNSGISMGFDRLNKFISIRKRIYTTIMAGTGLGKSSLLHSAYILNPYDSLLKDKRPDKPKFKVILFSMERSKVYTLAKWISRKIFIDHGVLIPVPKLLGWWDTKMTHEEHDYFLMYEDYITEMLDTKAVDIIEGNTNPTGVLKYIQEYARQNGKIEEIDEYHKIYIPNEENQVTIIAADHGSLIRKEKGLLTKKESIDKLSEYFQYFRDFYGYSPVMVMQQNRDISNPMLLKGGEAEPSLDHAKDSSSPTDDSDVVLSLYDPARYKQADPSGYILDNFRNPDNGAFHFRSLKILKSTYSEADIRIGLAFMGSTGSFSELPKASQMADFDYGKIFTGEYFLAKR